MYLSRVAIDIKKYETMKTLYNLERLHGMVESSFEGERRRNLWRIDKLAGQDYILLLSTVPPDNNILPEQIGFEGGSWETKSYDSFLDRIKVGSIWHFRLTANPTMSLYISGKTRGKVRAITPVPKQREWLRMQGEKKGFTLSDNGFDVIRNEWETLKKNGKNINIFSATFEGILTVTDSELFRQTLITGIGREKSYGMGLITVVPYE